MANKAIKYRLYPTKEQAIFFTKTFGCCRKIWNLMLADKLAYYNANGKMLATTPAQYKKEYPFLKEVDSLALANVQQHLQSAYTRFFKDKKVGFPKFKSKKRAKNSYTTNNQKGTVALVEGGIKLPKIGIVKAVIHRKPDEQWLLKSATISQASDGTYYASVLFEYDALVTEKVSVSNIADNAVLGLDYASDGLFVDSNGVKGTNHKFYRQSHKKLTKAQRRLSRMQGSRKNEKKSNNYKKQERKVGKIHRHIANQRKDNLHKLSTEIANQYDVVCVETLNMKAIANKGFHNGKATMDNGYGMFLTMLEYKLNDRGKYLVKIDKWYPSSQLCSQCGKQHKLELSERIYQCECGLVMNRDHNAAINIKNEGLRLLKEVA